MRGQTAFALLECTRIFSFAKSEHSLEEYIMRIATAKRKHTFTTRKMSYIALLCVISAIAMRIEISLPFFPPFYKLDISDAVILIGGFVFGPFTAFTMELLKNFIYVLFGGTSTAFIGELANVVMGCAFILPPTLLYQRVKTRKCACIGLILGTITLTICGGLCNYFVLLPMYATVYQLPLDALIAMGVSIHAGIDSLFDFVMLISIPFNLIKGSIISFLVWFSYKKISFIIKRIQ